MIPSVLITVALAHEFEPSILTLERIDDETWQVGWRPSPTDLGQSVFLEPSWPAGCALTGDRLRCRGLDRVAMPGVVESVAGVLVRVRDAEYEAVGVLTPGQSTWVFPEEEPETPRWRLRAVVTVAGAWSVLGTAHLLASARHRWSRTALWLVGIAGAVGVVAALAGCHQ